MEDRFKAWDGKCWVTENLFLSHDGFLWRRGKDRRLERIDWPVVRSTGLRDINGKLIFDSDILDFTIEAWPKRRGYVAWNAKSADYEIMGTQEGLDSEFCAAFGLDGAQHEVIGNLYESPNLLHHE